MAISEYLGELKRFDVQEYEIDDENIAIKMNWWGVERGAGAPSIFSYSTAPIQ